MTMNETTLLTAAALGVGSHIFYFNRGEHHLQGPLYFASAFFPATALTAVYFLSGPETRDVCLQIAQLASSYAFGIFSSLLVYRIFLHPLRNFPGPWGAKVSSLWFTLQTGEKQSYLKVQELHDKYGDFVRLGSSDLAIAHPEGVAAIYGAKSTCRKGIWYEGARPLMSLQTTRDKELHQKMRRVWSGAFSDKQLRGFDDRMVVFREKLVSRLRSMATDGTPIDVTKWFNLYTFDVMGNLAFSKSYEMLENSEKHWSIQILDKGLEPLGMQLPIWAFRILTSIPFLARDWAKYTAYTTGLIHERMKHKPETDDIMSTLLAPWEGKEVSEAGTRLLEGDAQLVIVAGSETTAATMVNMLYELVQRPEHFDKLRDELSPYVENGQIDTRNIQNLDHMNGVINETLRLHPPVPTAIHRLTPPEGIDIDGRHIPGNMNVWCSQYAIGRSEAIYVKPNEFIPERWYSKPELIIDSSAFAPFSIGPYSCIGKALALQDLRNTMSEVLLNFGVTAGPNDDMDKFEGDVREHFTLGLPSLRLVFKNRPVS